MKRRITLIEQLDAIPSENYINIHIDGKQITERCIDVFFHPNIEEMAGRTIRKIEPNFNQLEIFLTNKLEA